MEPRRNPIGFGKPRRNGADLGSFDRRRADPFRDTSGFCRRATSARCVLEPGWLQAGLGGYGGTIWVWDVATQKQLVTIEDAGGCVSWRPDGAQIAGALRGRHGGSVGCGNRARSCPGFTDTRATSGLPNGVRTDRDWPRPVSTRPCESGTPTRAIPCLFFPRGFGVSCVDWSRDSSRLALCGEIPEGDSVVVYDLADGRRHVVSGGMQKAVAWSADNRRLAFGGRETLRVWDASSGDVVTLQRETNVVRSIAWSHDGSRLASAANDGNITIWNMETDSQQSTTVQADGLYTYSVDWSAIRTAAVRDLLHAGHEVVLAVIDHFVGAEFARDLGLFRATHRRDHARSERFADLQCGATDASRGGVNEQCFTGLQVCAKDQRRIARRIDDR